MRLPPPLRLRVTVRCETAPLPDIALRAELAVIVATRRNSACVRNTILPRRIGIEEAIGPLGFEEATPLAPSPRGRPEPRPREVIKSPLVIVALLLVVPRQRIMGRPLGVTTSLLPTILATLMAEGPEPTLVETDRRMPRPLGASSRPLPILAKTGEVPGVIPLPDVPRPAEKE